MKTTPTNLSVEAAAQQITSSLNEKGFTLFCDINHQDNAKNVDMEMPASRLLIFGNPVAGTKLMQTDITMSLDLPLRLAIVEKNKQTLLIHQTSDDYSSLYQVANHPVLEKFQSLFEALISELD